MLTKKQRDLLLFIHDRLQVEGIPPSFDEMKDALELKSKSGIHRLITALEERGFIRRLPNRARALEILRLPEGYQETGPGSNAGIATNATPENQQPAQAENMSALARRGFKPSIIEGGLSETAEPVDAGGFSETRQAGFSGSSSVDVPVMGKIAAGVPISAIEIPTHSMAFPPNMVGAGEHFALQVEGESMIDAGIHDGDTVLICRTNIATIGDIVVALVDDQEATLKRFRRDGNSIALEAANPAHPTRVYDQNRVKVQGRLVGLLRNYQ